MNSPRTNVDDVWDKNFKSYFSVDQIPEISYTYGPYPVDPCAGLDNLPLPPMRLDPYAAAKQAIMNNPAISDAAKAAAIAALNNAQKYAGTGPVLPPPPPIFNPNRPSSGGGNGGIICPDGRGGENPTGGGTVGVVITITEDGVEINLFIDPYASADQAAQIARALLAPPAASCTTEGKENPGDPSPPTPWQPPEKPPGGNPDTPPRTPPPGGGNNPGGGGGGRNPFLPRSNGIGPVNLP